MCVSSSWQSISDRERHIYLSFSLQFKLRCSKLRSFLSSANTDGDINTNSSASVWSVLSYWLHVTAPRSSAGLAPTYVPSCEVCNRPSARTDQQPFAWRKRLRIPRTSAGCICESSSLKRCWRMNGNNDSLCGHVRQLTTHSLFMMVVFQTVQQWELRTVYAIRPMWRHA